MARPEGFEPRLGENSGSIELVLYQIVELYEAPITVPVIRMARANWRGPQTSLARCVLVGLST